MKSIYVGSIWWENCDPFIGVIATSYQKAEEKLAGLVRDEYLQYNSGLEEGEEGLAKIMSSGVFAEQFSDLDMFVCPNHCVEEVVDALETEGVFVC